MINTLINNIDKASSVELKYLSEIEPFHGSCC